MNCKVSLPEFFMLLGLSRPELVLGTMGFSKLKLFPLNYLVAFEFVKRNSILQDCGSVLVLIF